MRESRARGVDLIGEIQTETSMPRFKNRRRERFAWMIAKGMYEGPLLTAGLLRHLSCAGSASKRSWGCAAPGGRQRRRDGAAPESLQRRVAVSAFADSPWCHGEGPRCARTGDRPVREMGVDAACAATPSYYAETIAIILLRIFCIADSERIPASEMKSDSFAVNNLAGRAKLCIWSPPLVKS